MFLKLASLASLAAYRNGLIIQCVTERRALRAVSIKEVVCGRIEVRGGRARAMPRQVSH